MNAIFTDSALIASAGRLSELVDEYAVDEELPSTEWLTRLRLERPRRTIACLQFRTRLLKRACDISIAVGLLLVLWPVMAVVAVLVKFTSPGPVVFRQMRVGLNKRNQSSDRRHQSTGNSEVERPSDRRSQCDDRRNDFSYGRAFVLYKFRTMRADAERDGAQWAVAGDQRITPIGRFLRKTRLDEVPQLWNVLRGEMTLVGPRPERPEFIEELSAEIPDYLDRLGLKPGLTGLAQVLNGYDNDLAGFRRKVALDLLYLQNCCLWNDFKILFRTVGVVLTGKGAL